VEAALEEMQFSVALTAIWKLVSRTNKYIDETEPWALVKDENKRAYLGNVMAHLVESLRVVGVMLQPFITEAPIEIIKQIGINEEKLTLWDSLVEQGQIPTGTKVVKGDPIFPRLDVKEESEKIKDLMQSTLPKQEAAKEKPKKAEIAYDDFAKLDLRVGEITEAEK